MTTPAPATGSGTHPVGPHLVIASAETAAALTPVLSALPPLPGALLVLAAAPDAAPVLRHALPDLVALAGGRGATRLVLAASGLATEGPGGGRPVQAVAATADFPVIAPDGAVTVEPDGRLRLAAPGTWWLAEPGAEPVELGPGWPPEEPPAQEEPEEWEEEGQEGEQRQAEEPLPPPAPPVRVVAESQGGVHGCGATPAQGPGGGPAEHTRAVPGGVWLGGPPETVEPLIGVAPDTFLLGVGSPARPTLPPVELLDRTPADAADARHLLLAAPWADPAELVAMAVALADRFDRTVRAAIGLPVRSADAHATTFLDARGAPTWQPLLLELAASPAHHRVAPSAWLAPSGPEATGPARYACPDLEDWVIELVPAGLWLRPAERVTDARPRTVRPDPAGPVLIAGDGERPLGPEVRRALPAVLATLPDLGATEPYGLLLHGDASDEEQFRSWAGELNLRRLGSAHPRPAPTTAARPEPAPEPRTGPVPRPAASEPPGAAPAPAPPPTPTPAQPLPPTSASSPEREEPEPPVREESELPVRGEPEPAVRGESELPVREEPEPAVQGEPELPLREEPEPPGRAASVAPPVPVPPSMPGGRSGPDDRAALRELLGEKYHVLAGKAELLASRLPSLRSLAQDGLKPDLVAIAVYQADAPGPGSRAGLAQAARAAAPGPFTPLLRCLESGLRRLPGHYGAVMLAIPEERVPLDRYVPGTVLVEPAAVAAVPACDAELEGAVEFGIWSTTGRRTSVFSGTDDEPEVVFPPGTAFSVLALHLPEDDTGTIRVLLREISPAETEGADDRSQKRDEQARTRLTEWFERRDMLEPHDRRPVPDATRFHVAPGVVLH
ncbi:hypothetical protein ACIRTB_12830 [Streptomyces sp. NPDC101158]|uniref:hypothetical protein n=1 Tax=Streptomyces sp. NPDC101158 TaxID=3366117 RepID=UPI0038037B64